MLFSLILRAATDVGDSVDVVDLAAPYVPALGYCRFRWIIVNPTSE